MATFAARLSETAPTWGRAVAPYAEWTARTLWSRRKRISNSGPATPLTQQRRREAKGRPSFPLTTAAPRPSVCRTCGTSIPARACYCGSCGFAAAQQRLRTASYEGREKSRGEEAQAKRAMSQRRHMLAKSAWEQSKELSPITEEDFLRDVQPRLAALRIGTIRSALGVSKAYASAIRSGQRRPHPRHWQALAQLAGVSAAV
jgi:ribosomal protein L37E